MAVLGFTFDLKEQLVFYGSYHNNRINQAIHFIFVPIIMWTVSVWLAYTPAVQIQHGLESVTNLDTGGYLIPNASFALILGYGVYYIVLDVLAGASWSICIGLPMWWSSEAFRDVVPSAWAWALGIHILGWVMQIYPGHMLAEKRRPALMDSFFQSLVLAPLFVWFELLFLIGFRPTLRNEVESLVTANIEAYTSAKESLVTK